MDRTTRPLVIFAAFAGSLLVGLVIVLWALGGLRGVTAPAAIGGPFQLTDQAGQTVTDQNLKGRPTLIFFGFTHCPDVCPTSLFEISEVLKAMGKDADRVNAYFVSVDPERDTATAMKAAASPVKTQSWRKKTSAFFSWMALKKVFCHLFTSTLIYTSPRFMATTTASRPRAAQRSSEDQ
jgi:cytochrome oxidase Cu insertion factor (SCO1/SenC/PrrC family)